MIHRLSSPARVALAVSLTLAAACGSKSASSGGGTGPAAGGARVCPGPDAVVPVSWASSDDPVWRAYLTNKNIDANPDGGPDASVKAITADEAKAAGLATLPTVVWIPQPGGTMCRATVTGPFRSVMSMGPISEQLGVALTGCPAPAKDAPNQVYGLVGDGDLSACQWVPAQTVAERAEGEGDGAGEHWLPPTKETPIPAAIAAKLTAKDCKAPACEHLWRVRDAGGAVVEVLETWMNIDPSVDPCALQHDDAFTLFRTDGGKLGKLPARPGDRDDSVSGIFKDAGGARLVVLENTGWMDVRDLDSQKATGREWFSPNEEDSFYFSMAPYCGP